MTNPSCSTKVNQEQLDTAIESLADFVAIPSVSNPDNQDYSIEALQAAADFASERLREMDFNVRQVSIEGSAPYVLAEKIVDSSKPTILCYAHYDVQPVDRSQWSTDPFILTEKDGRLYGRGSSDDKGGVMAIITALNSYQNNCGSLPCNIKILFEGEEEYGSTHMDALIEQESESIQADALIILDGENKDIKTGTLLTSTRGILTLQLEVQTMAAPTHSGTGCLVPDPAQIMSQLIYSLKDPRSIPGFMDDCEPLSPSDREKLAEDSQTAESYANDHQLFEGVKLRGNPETSVYERIVEEPSISCLNGSWGVPNGGNSIQPSASCQIGIRLTAWQDPAKIAEVLKDYLLSQEVQGAYVTLEQLDEGAFAWQADLSGPYTEKYLEAMGENFSETHVQPTGGTLPFLRSFGAAFPDMEIIIPAVADPTSNIHSNNESQDIHVFEMAINSLISFITKVGESKA